MASRKSTKSEAFSDGFVPANELFKLLLDPHEIDMLKNEGIYKHLPCCWLESKDRSPGFFRYKLDKSEDTGRYTTKLVALKVEVKNTEKLKVLIKKLFEKYRKIIKASQKMNVAIEMLPHRMPIIKSYWRYAHIVHTQTNRTHTSGYCIFDFPFRRSVPVAIGFKVADIRKFVDNDGTEKTSMVGDDLVNRVSEFFKPIILLAQKQSPAEQSASAKVSIEKAMLGAAYYCDVKVTGLRYSAEHDVNSVREHKSYLAFKNAVNKCLVDTSLRKTSGKISKGETEAFKLIINQLIEENQNQKHVASLKQLLS